MDRMLTMLPLPRSAHVGEILGRYAMPSPLLRCVDVVDVFERGECVSYTFRFTYGSPERTLTEQEIHPIHERVLETFRHALQQHA